MKATNFHLDTANSGSNDNPLNLFRQHDEPWDCAPETELFRQEQPIRAVYLIERGLVKFTRNDSQGREMIVAIRFPGNVLGAAAVISRSLASVTATTLTECRLFQLSTEVFLKLVETDAEFSQRVLRTISKQFYEQTTNLARVGMAPALARVAHLLLQVVSKSKPQPNGEVRLELPAKHIELAKMLAISKEHFTRQLGELEKMGIIRRSKDWIYVRDAGRLARVAQE